jgi:hypothetical protein
MAAGQFQQGVRPGLLGPIGGHGKADIVGFLDHLTLAHFLDVRVEAHDLGDAG